MRHTRLARRAGTVLDVLGGPARHEARAQLKRYQRNEIAYLTKHVAGFGFARWVGFAAEFV